MSEQVQPKPGLYLYHWCCLKTICPWWVSLREDFSWRGWIGVAQSWSWEWTVVIHSGGEDLLVKLHAKPVPGWQQTS